MSDSSVSVAFWVMVALQTMGSVDMPGSGERKMPAPRSYMAIIVMFSALHLVADAGFARAASIAAWAAVLIGTIKGPFGGQLTKLVNAVAPPAAGVSPLTAPVDTSGGSSVTAYPAPGGNAP